MESFDVSLQRGGLRLSTQSKVLYGLRGFGKTVLLREFVSHARRGNWIVVAVEAQAGESLMPALTRRFDAWLRR